MIESLAKYLRDRAMDHSDHSGHMAHEMDHSTHMSHAIVPLMDMGNETDGGMDHMDGMSMYFHGGTSEYILFEWWHISTVGGLIGSMIGIFFLALIYEGIKFWREHLFRKYTSSTQFRTCVKDTENGHSRLQPPESNQCIERIIFPPGLSMMSIGHSVQTLLHMLQFFISYLLMLIFMTYNVWLCLAVILGAGCGYFLFGWKKSVVVDITEHCH